MRKSRTSGSVEGAMGNHSSYSDPVKGEEGGLAHCQSKPQSAHETRSDSIASPSRET
jgi:hypothetical protein